CARWSCDQRSLPRACAAPVRYRGSGQPRSISFLCGSISSREGSGMSPAQAYWPPRMPTMVANAGSEVTFSVLRLIVWCCSTRRRIGSTISTMMRRPSTVSPMNAARRKRWLKGGVSVIGALFRCLQPTLQAGAHLVRHGLVTSRLSTGLHLLLRLVELLHPRRLGRRLRRRLRRLLGLLRRGILTVALPRVQHAGS